MKGKNFEAEVTAMPRALLFEDYRVRAVMSRELRDQAICRSSRTRAPGQ